MNFGIVALTIDHLLPRPRSAHRLSHASNSKAALLQEIPEGGVFVDDKVKATTTTTVLPSVAGESLWLL